MSKHPESKSSEPLRKDSADSDPTKPLPVIAPGSNRARKSTSKPSRSQKETDSKSVGLDNVPEVQIGKVVADKPNPNEVASARWRESKLPSLKPKRRAPQPASVTDKGDASIEQGDEVGRASREPNEFGIFAPVAVDFQSAKAAFEKSDEEHDDQPITINQKLKRNRNPLSSFTISVLAHVLMYVILALFIFKPNEPAANIGLVATIDAQPTLKNPADEEEVADIQIELPEETESPLEDAFNDTARHEETLEVESPEAVINAVAENTEPSPNDMDAPMVPNQNMPTGGGLEGREATARARLAATRGGSEASELAVEEALHWIIKHQRPDGSWRFFHEHGDCDCANEGSRESTTAATGLALMSLMGAGYTHKTGIYQEEVGKGLEYLMSRMRHTRHGGSLAEGKDGMYSHGIATCALAEAFTMTRDSSLVNAVSEAQKFIVSAQHVLGGWRYNPGYPGDMTVTGWQVMALRSCQLAGMPLERECMDKAEQFIDSLGTESSGRYGYQKPDETNPTTTAVGLMSKMYLGMPKDSHNLKLGSQFVFGKKPSREDVYFNYYATQLLHHIQGPNWKVWNEEMRDYLVNTQDRSGSHQAGSWYFDDKHAKVGGRLYTTAMAVMTLEVYYRFMPLYEEEAVEAKEVDPSLIR